jgi:hypothetical protein
MIQNEKEKREMKIVVTNFVAVGCFALCFAFVAVAQNAPQEFAPRKASAQFQKDYDGAKKADAEISRDRANGYAKVDQKLRPRLVSLKGTVAQLGDEMKQQCVDGNLQPLPQGCHYVESGEMKGYIVANPIPAPKVPQAAPPAAAAPPPTNVQPPAATPAPKSEEPKPAPAKGDGAGELK